MIVRVLQFAKKTIIIALSYINAIVPKNSIVLFYNDTIRDNNKYLMEYMAKHTEAEIVCFTNEVETDSNITRNIHYITRTTELFKYMMTSKVLVTSFDHRYIIRPTKSQTFIQLWHGYALKNIGHDYKLKKWDRRGNYYTEFLCYSLFWKKSICDAFGADPRQLKIWDNPRNDLLYRPISKDDIKSVLNVNQFNSLILWMPTYRKSHKLRDSEDSSKDIPIIDGENIDAINSCLAENQNILIIKPHPLQNELTSIIKKCSNIYLIDNSFLDDKRIELYRLLAASDALITDYSSVYFDYLKLNKPIGFAFDDIEEYQIKRGFAFDKIEELMPGPKLNNTESLCTFLSSPEQFDKKYCKERNDVRNKISYWNDDNNCQRIAEHILQCLD